MVSLKSIRYRIWWKELVDGGKVVRIPVRSRDEAVLVLDAIALVINTYTDEIRLFPNAASASGIEWFCEEDGRWRDIDALDDLVLSMIPEK